MTGLPALFACSIMYLWAIGSFSGGVCPVAIRMPSDQSSIVLKLPISTSLSIVAIILPPYLPSIFFINVTSLEFLIFDAVTINSTWYLRSGLKNSSLISLMTRFSSSRKLEKNPALCFISDCGVIKEP